VVAAVAALPSQDTTSELKEVVVVAALPLQVHTSEVKEVVAAVAALPPQEHDE
jgi:hypothetical protein